MNQTPEVRNDTLKPIHLKEVFSSKNPRLARCIPGFIYSWLKRVVCLNEINDFISKHGERKGIDFADAVMEYLELSVDVKGIENLPARGNAVFSFPIIPWEVPTGLP